MATYKVLQDIEAEDKLLGPLTLRQFIYAAIVIILGFVAFKLATVAWFLAIPFAPPMIFFGLLAAPIGQVQSSEVWLLAKLRYYIFPRRRIWDPAGIVELVTITVPKQVERHLTKDFSQDQVQSRLKALANTLDTRGWAVKNITPGAYQQLAATAPATQDRLVDIGAIPQDVSPIDMPSIDVLDTETNPLAQKMGNLLDESSDSHRMELLSKVRKIAKQQSGSETSIEPPTLGQSVIKPQPKSTPAPAAPNKTQPILNSSGEPLHRADISPQMPVLNTVVENPAQKAQAPMTTPAKTDTLTSVQDKGPSSLAISHNDDDASPDEVVVSLH